MRIAKTSRLLDLNRLRVVESELPDRTLRELIAGTRPVHINLRLTPEPLPNGAAKPQEVPSAADLLQTQNKVVNEHGALFDLLERRIARHAELVHRETGLHPVWLGYPLLFVAAQLDDESQSVLAPLFLWPVSVQTDLKKEGRIVVRRREGTPLVFNRPLASWLSRAFDVDFPIPGEDDLLDLTPESLSTAVNRVASWFQRPADFNLGPPLRPVPELGNLMAQGVPQVVNSAVLGHFRWQHEAVIADLARMRYEDCVGPVEGFVSQREFEQPRPLPPPPESDRYFVFDADFSQERVVWRARQGEGLVVHGPPGTGKSQTIVNIVADALAHGQTILMVCQKQAATRVVHERLRAAGLADLCIEVHDIDTDRRTVFGAIRAQVEALPPEVGHGRMARRETVAHSIEEIEQELDAYHAALHRIDDEIGISYRSLRAREGRLLLEHPRARPLPSLAEILRDSSVKEVDRLRPRLVELGSLFERAMPLDNPWRYRRPSVRASATLSADVAELLSAVETADLRHRDFVATNGRGFALPKNPADFQRRALEASRALEGMLRSSQFEVLSHLVAAFVRRLRTPDDRDALSSQVVDVGNLARRVEQSTVDSAFDALSSGDDLARLALKETVEVYLVQRSRWWRFVSPPFHRARKYLARALPNVQKDLLPTVATRLLSHLDAVEVRHQLEAALLRLLPKHVHEWCLSEDGVGIARSAQTALQVASLLVDLERVCSLGAVFPSNETARIAEWTEALDHLRRAIGRGERVEAVLRCLSHLDVLLEDSVLASARELTLLGESLADWIASVRRGFEALEALDAWEANHESQGGLMRAIVDELEQHEAKRRNEEVGEQSADRNEPVGPRWAALVEAAALARWSEKLLRGAPVLRQLTPAQADAKRVELGRLLASKRELESGVIREAWLQRQVAHRGEPWKRVFQLRRSKYGEAKRLREAVQACFEPDPRDGSKMGLLHMRPCWLTSPETVCQIFPLLPGLFDLVIFDEASQCPLEQAVPVIYRGRRVVVTGDEWQLPPTSFFMAKELGSEMDGDDEDADATEAVVSTAGNSRELLNQQFLFEAEDLLQVATAKLPEEYLSVHYRSEHEALIQFSNRAFYRGRLEAPPSVQPLGHNCRPIEFHDVQGVYDRRTNVVEAKEVVRWLAGQWATDNDRPTVGVVTFNRPQADLIRDLLDQRCQRDAAFAARFRQENDRREHGQDVGFFIKNLENVQGDERDIMVFSTTFGRDPEGRFYRRFGPVGGVGGERRLNVAVTRARQRVVVITSMPIDEVASALRSAGDVPTGLTPAGYLQLYLAYARAVSAGDREAADGILNRLGRGSPTVAPTAEPGSPFEEDVRAAIERLGYVVDAQVGESGFLIDLAVRASEPEGGYILGIECDGATFHSTRSARLRDVWRQQILEGRGWFIHRVWSTNWWSHREKEIDRLSRALYEAREKSSQRKVTPASSESEEGNTLVSEAPSGGGPPVGTLVDPAPNAPDDSSTKEPVTPNEPSRPSSLINVIAQIEPELEDPTCPRCCSAARIEITREGVVVACKGSCRSVTRIAVSVLQRVADRLIVTCFSCRATGLKSMERPFGVLLKCRQCDSNNSWEGVARRMFPSQRS